MRGGDGGGGDGAGNERLRGCEVTGVVSSTSGFGDCKRGDSSSLIDTDCLRTLNLFLIVLITIEVDEVDASGWSSRRTFNAHPAFLSTGCSSSRLYNARLHCLHRFVTASPKLPDCSSDETAMTETLISVFSNPPFFFPKSPLSIVEPLTLFTLGLLGREGR